MSQFPALPNTLVSRQLECVSCKEQFTVSEDILNFGNIPTAEWQASSDAFPTINLRFQLERDQRPITPEARSAPRKTPPRGGSYRQLYHVNCPRCGTDNRNWLHITNNRVFIFRYWRLIPIIVGILLSLVIAYVAYMNYESPDRIDISSRSKWILIIAAMMATISPILSITKNWRQQRDYEFTRKFIHPFTTKKEIDPSIRSGALSLLIFVVVLPLVFFVLIPWGFFTFTNLLMEEEVPTQVERLDTITAELPSTLFEAEKTDDDREPVLNALIHLEDVTLARNYRCTSAIIEPIITELEALPIDNIVIDRPGLRTTAVDKLRRLQQSNQPFCQDDLVSAVIDDLEFLKVADNLCASTANKTVCIYEVRLGTIINRIDNTLRPAEKPIENRLLTNTAWTLSVLADARELANSTIGADVIGQLEADIVTIEEFVLQPAEEWFFVDNRFLIEWGLFVGIAAVLGMFVSITAVTEHLRKINRHLPRPIFSSVANMTRVVLWEVNRALEIGDIIQHIQWTTVQRNDIGGVDLHGVYRDAFGSEDDSASGKVRAQIYTIRTDKWGRIEKAYIADRLVPTRPRLPIFPAPEVIPVPADVPRPTHLVG